MQTNVDALVAELAVVPSAPGVARLAAVDADGTLWAQDVGLIVFEWMVKGRRLRAPAAPRIEAELASTGEAPTGDPHDDAWRLFELYREGRYPERDVCSLMAWTFAGYPEPEARAHCRAAIDAADLSGHVHEGVRELLAGLRQIGLRVVVVSASPAWGVEVGCADLGVAPADVRAIEVNVDEHGVCLPDVRVPVTYREGKVEAIRALTGGARPLVVLGDSAGDLPMLGQAVLAVAVQPRPAVLAAAQREPERWRVLRFARTVSGIEVQAPEIDRVVV